MFQPEVAHHLAQVDLGEAFFGQVSWVACSNLRWHTTLPKFTSGKPFPTLQLFHNQGFSSRGHNNPVLHASTAQEAGFAVPKALLNSPSLVTFLLPFRIATIPCTALMAMVSEVCACVRCVCAYVCACVCYYTQRSKGIGTQQTWTILQGHTQTRCKAPIS